MMSDLLPLKAIWIEQLKDGRARPIYEYINGMRGYGEPQRDGNALAVSTWQPLLDAGYTLDEIQAASDAGIVGQLKRKYCGCVLGTDVRDGGPLICMQPKGHDGPCKAYEMQGTK